MVLVRRRERDERGAAAVLVAVMAVVLLLAVGLVVDLGLARDTRGKSQNAADASALAAGNVLYGDTDLPHFVAAVDAAMTYAEKNFDVSAADWAGCTDAGRLAYTPPHVSPCISFDEVARPTRVRVRIPDRTVQTAFAGLAGVDEYTIAASATAALDPGVVLKCSLCVLGDGPHTVINGDATVTGSSVHFNGSVSTGPQGHVEAPGHQITVEENATGTYNPTAETHSPRMGDPLSTLTLPTPSGPPKNNPCTDGPGVYGARSFGNNETCQLTPGLYVLTDVWSMGNSTVFSGSGVTLYAVCGTHTAPRPCAAPGEPGGQFDASNGNKLTLSAGAPGFGDLAIVYDRNNTSQVRVQGNGETNITGTIYAVSSTLYANGNSGNGVTGGSIIVDGIDLNGQYSHLKVTNGIDREWRIPPGGLHLAE